METIPSELNLSKLLEAVKKLDFDPNDNGFEMVVPQDSGIPQHLKKHPEIAEALSEIDRLRGLSICGMMINRLIPGKEVRPHVDDVHKDIERWHLPLQTNHNARWWDEVNGHVCLLVGWWWLVPNMTMHQVYNRGDCDRYHLVVDLWKAGEKSGVKA